MKVIYSKEEVERIVLNHARLTVGDNINSIEIRQYSEEDFVTLSTKYSKVVDTSTAAEELPF